MKKKQFRWVIALLVIILFAITTPKTIQDYGQTNNKHYRVDNYLVFSTCSASYQMGEKWKVHQIGILGMKFKIR